jgi:ATP-binding cassette subfamily F protein 3
MPDLIASSLAVSFGARPLFDEVSVTVDPGDRIALVGPNGAGKTTLMRVLARELTPTAGEIRVPAHIRVGLHDQRPERVSTPVREWVAPAHMVELEAELRRLEGEMASGDPAIMDAWQDVRNQYDHGGGEGWTVTVEQVLRGLGFRDDQLDQPLDTLSGGELTRASLARTLAAQPDVLLLDEPTNHLDIDTIEWLQDHLSSLKGGLVLVSHDRWFIEAVCTSVIEIAGGKSRRFNGSFVQYRAQQALEAANFQKNVAKWQTEVARLQRFVDRFSAGTRSRQATSRTKILDKLREDAPVFNDISQRASIGFQLPKVTQPGRTVFEISDLALAFQDESGATTRTLLDPSELVVERGDKIVIMGANGAGKSTFLHALASFACVHEEAPEALRSGEVRIGYDVRTRVLSQHDSELVDTQSMLGNMNLAAPGIGRTDAQNLLGLFGFTGDDAQKLVGSLSGGERRRLMLAMALTGADNVLLIDEPTNHLDIESREGLEAALAEWPGTLILISHDRALVEGVATRTVVLHDQKLVNVIGGYDEARAVIAGETAISTDPAERMRQLDREKAAAAAADRERRAKQSGKSGAKSKSKQADAPSTPGSRTVTRGGAKGKAAKGAKSERGKVRRPATIEGEIEKIDAEMTTLNAQMLDPDVYTDPARSTECLNQLAKLERDLTNRWSELETSHEVYGS